MSIMNAKDPWFISVYIPDFSAQAYAAHHPEASGRPFVVTRQNPDSHKSVVASLSPEARARGIFHGFPIARLMERFGDILVVQEDPALSASITEDLATVLSAYSPDFRMSGHSGAIVNVSGMERLLKDRLFSLPREIRDTVCRTLAIRQCSCGAAGSAFMASMAAKAAAPDGIHICEVGREMDMLGRLPAAGLPGISPHVRQRLDDYNIRRVSDIQRLSNGFLTSRFREEGSRLYNMVRGRFFQSAQAASQADAEEGLTLPSDINDRDTIRGHIRYITDRLVFQLRSRSMQASALTFEIVYSDARRAQRTCRLRPATADFITLYKCGLALFDEAYTRRIAVRRLSLAAKQEVSRETQLDLFDGVNQVKQENMGKSIEQVRTRMGFNVVVNGNGQAQPSPKP